MKESGIDILELTDYHPKFDYTNHTAFRTLRQTLDDLALQVYTLHAHLMYLDPICDPTASTPEQRQHLLARYRQAIDAFKLIGGGIMVTHDIALPDVGDPEHEWKRAALVNNLQSIARYAADHNVRIAVENLTSGYFSDPANLLTLVEEIDLINLGICIDTGHRNLHGDPTEALRMAGDYLFTVHIHDNHGTKDEHLLPTRGTIDWPGVLNALAAIDYPGVFMYELSRPDDIGQVTVNFEQLHSL
ncbi:sugar phosphate isomerase/epimerase [Chloroflexi bacterium TSY]|nr:sugar phosphate isomerase/epimerase [Chloroflexi bacterium TSY]